MGNARPGWSSSRVVPAVRASWSVSIAVWVVTLLFDVAVVLWSSTWQIRVYECESYFFPSVMLVLIMIALPTAYAMWRCVLHLRAEPARRSTIRRVRTALTLVGPGSVVAAVIVLSVSNHVGPCGA
jgi:hypothetical protein